MLCCGRSMSVLALHCFRRHWVHCKTLSVNGYFKVATTAFVILTVKLWDVCRRVSERSFSLSSSTTILSTREESDLEIAILFFCHLLTTYLFMPLQQHGAAVVRGSLEASVDIFHQQVHSSSVQWAHRLLDVTALETAQHFDHQHLCSVLHTQTTHIGGRCISNTMGLKVTAPICWLCLNRKMCWKTQCQHRGLCTTYKRRMTVQKLHPSLKVWGLKQDLQTREPS